MCKTTLKQITILCDNRKKNLNFAAVFFLEIDAFTVEMAEIRFANSPVNDNPTENNVLGIPEPNPLIPTVGVYRARLYNT
jgi:hypothetical protein